MTVLLAHHLEVHHVPILLSFFAAGFFIGWQVLSRWLGRPAVADPAKPVPDGGSRG